MQFYKTMQTEKSKQAWCNKKFQNAISRKKQALNRFRELPTASNKTRVLKISEKTISTVKEAKCNHFSKVFSNCLNEPKSF